MTLSQRREDYDLTIYENLDDLTRAAADIVVDIGHRAVAQGHFNVALSGGSTPRKLHTELAAPPYRERINWSRIEFFWGDERYVPQDDPESNYRMARETLLDHVPVQPSQVHPIPTQMGDPAATAVAYSDELRRVFHLGPDELPRFDLILLGMGPDGHTASLFPHTAALHAQRRLVVANAVPQLQVFRITLTAEVINNGANVVFLVAGPDKADALHEVLEGAHDPETYPSQLIAPTTGKLHWLADRAAAAKLTKR
jgi:6-phosphogluconolactonase